MAYLIGIVLALLSALLARSVGFDRDRAFYPTLLIVIGSYYVLFAVMGGSTHALMVESVGTTVFAALAVVGFRRSLWWVVAALAGHGIFDFLHAGLVTNPGVPAWWPAFCLSYDVVLAGSLAWLLSRSYLASRRPVVPLSGATGHDTRR